MDDLISRRQAIGALNDEYHGMISDESMKIYQIINWISALPSAHPQRKKGKWILVHEADENGNALYECSVCHKGETHVPTVDVSYCWNCGARMDGGESDED